MTQNERICYCTPYNPAPHSVCIEEPTILSDLANTLKEINRTVRKLKVQLRANEEAAQAISVAMAALHEANYGR